jgi:dipeptidyl aminopeptidase/acylaminoacyl peptidase
MQLTIAKTWSPRPIATIGLLALLLLALAASALFIGRSQTPSLYRNGAVVYAADGDLYIADQLGGTPRPLVAGPESDSMPVFSYQGDRVAFVRAFVREGPDWPGVRRIMSVGLDGSRPMELASLEGGVSSIDWSPDGAALLATWNTAHDPRHYLLTSLPATAQEPGGSTREATWSARPGGRAAGTSR